MDAEMRAKYAEIGQQVRELYARVDGLEKECRSIRTMLWRYQK
jgi:outer membrane murein-binding lipoprotein Lpp